MSVKLTIELNDDEIGPLIGLTVSAGSGRSGAYYAVNGSRVDRTAYLAALKMREAIIAKLKGDQ